MASLQSLIHPIRGVEFVLTVLSAWVCQSCEPDVLSKLFGTFLHSKINQLDYFTRFLFQDRLLRQGLKQKLRICDGLHGDPQQHSKQKQT